MTTEVETKPAGELPVKEEVKEVEKEEKVDQENEEAKKVEEKKKEKVVAPPKPTVHKADYEKNMVYMYQFSRTPVLPSISPFCLKVETFLRVAGIKYENVGHQMKLRSKKGMLPFVEINGEEIADSAVIIRDLSTKFDVNLDANLTADQRNMSHAFISMVENHLLWVVLSWRTKPASRMIEGYRLNLQKMLKSKLPTPVLNFTFRMRMRAKAKAVKAVGFGVQTCDEISQLGCDDLKVLSDQLQDKPFFFGDEPTLLDIVVFSTVAQLVFLDKSLACPLRSFIEEHHTNLLGHTNRIKERFFCDWDEMCESLELNTHLPKPAPPPPAADQQQQADKEKEKEKEVQKNETEAASGDKNDNNADKSDENTDKKADEDKDKAEDNKQAEEKKE